MTTTVRITFSDDAEAAHFAAMLQEEHGVICRPPGDDNGWEELWPGLESVEAVTLERQP